MSNLYQEYKNALTGDGSPTLFLDLEALEANMDWVIENAGGKKIRIATKSIRSVEVLRRILNYSEVFQGLMTYTLEEALWLRELGFSDILMGYPTMDQASLEKLAQDPRGITLMVDLDEHLELLESLSPKEKFSVCLDIDLSMDLPGVRFGVFRSALNGADSVKSLVRKFKGSSRIRITGLMGYEAQIAGVGDEHSLLMRSLKKISIKQLRIRREEVFSALKQEGIDLLLVNGGGTGSLQSTRQESCVTEITVGSGFFAPGLFDHYQDFKLRPALAFTLPIVRRPSIDIVTCLGGGYVASGAVESTKLPVPYLPEGLELLKHEGAGEVQTPLKLKSGVNLNVGEFVIMRHAKAGEACERFNEIKLIRKGNLLGVVPTYRGQGKCFL